jgi:dihydrofolate synthase/folylpolyglutamate synthase
VKDRAISILTSQSHFYIDLGLDRIREVLRLLGNPQDKLKYIHVAGTNGKGSVCAILNKILQSNGYKVGLYTSPHIFEYNERIKVDSVDIDDKSFEDYVILVTELSQKNKIHLTEFEILTIVAILYFNHKKVDIVVLETGLGGRFDATNVINSNLCSVIVHIDLEHTDRLGKTIEEISFEKAGIIKEGCPVVIGEDNAVIKQVAKDKSSRVYFADTTDKKCSLKGVHQNFNLALALKVCEILNINVCDDILMDIKNPLRFEYLKEYNILVDVSHNPNSIKALRDNLDKYYPNQNFDFIFGCLSTKDYKKMLKILLNKNDNLFFYEFKHPNACRIENIDVKVKKFDEYKKSPRLTVICGSFYMLKELFKDMDIKYSMNS